MTPWITIVGVGDDGLAGLTPAVRTLIDTAELLVGGDRHQAMVNDTAAERLTWAGGLDTAMAAMEDWRGRRVVVLATGDPMCYGAGTNLQRRFGADEIAVIPVPGAFSLTCARMRWSVPDTELVTVHGRPVESVNLHVQAGARLVIFSRDGDSPRQVVDLLVDRGFGPSAVTVFEHLGGPAERRLDGVAGTWTHDRCADLNTVAVECRPGPDAQDLPLVPGLPDEAFHNDGQLTKREVRALTVPALVPRAGAVLWDVGGGAGSVGIEWLRAAPRRKAHAVGRGEAKCVTFERNPARCSFIARNAAFLGVPNLHIVAGEAPAAFADADGDPDVVFVGGGLAEPGLLEACWERLPSGGRLVANGVTVEATERLLAFRDRVGGTFVRIAIDREQPVGEYRALKPLAPVLQFRGDKP